MNNKIIETNLFKEYYFSPAASDNGLSLEQHFLSETKLILKKYINKNKLNPYLGPSYANDHVLNELNKFNLKFTKTINPAKYAARKIYEGKIIGFFKVEVNLCKIFRK